MKNTYEVKAKVWRYPGMAGWFFVHIDKKQSEILKERYGKTAGGFGSIKVEVTLGESKWNTSIFPDKHSGTYLLPLKAAIRRVEGIDDGDAVSFRVRIV